MRIKKMSALKRCGGEGNNNGNSAGLDWTENTMKVVSYFDLCLKAATDDKRREAEADFHPVQLSSGISPLPGSSCDAIWEPKADGDDDDMKVFSNEFSSSSTTSSSSDDGEVSEVEVVEVDDAFTARKNDNVEEKEVVIALSADEDISEVKKEVAVKTYSKSTFNQDMAAHETVAAVTENVKKDDININSELLEDNPQKQPTTQSCSPIPDCSQEKEKKSIDCLISEIESTLSDVQNGKLLSVEEFTCVSQSIGQAIDLILTIIFSETVGNFKGTPGMTPEKPELPGQPGLEELLTKIAQSCLGEVVIMLRNLIFRKEDAVIVKKEDKRRRNRNGKKKIGRVNSVSSPEDFEFLKKLDTVLRRHANCFESVISAEIEAFELTKNAIDQQIKNHSENLEDAQKKVNDIKDSLETIVAVKKMLDNQLQTAEEKYSFLSKPNYKSELQEAFDKATSALTSKRRIVEYARSYWDNIASKQTFRAE